MARNSALYNKEQFIALFFGEILALEKVNCNHLLRCDTSDFTCYRVQSNTGNGKTFVL